MQRRYMAIYFVLSYALHYERRAIFFHGIFIHQCASQKPAKCHDGMAISSYEEDGGDAMGHFASIFLDARHKMALDNGERIMLATKLHRSIGYSASDRLRTCR